MDSYQDVFEAMNDYYKWKTSYENRLKQLKNKNYSKCKII